MGLCQHRAAILGPPDHSSNAPLAAEQRRFYDHGQRLAVFGMRVK
jgi:hypothetical protein